MRALCPMCNPDMHQILPMELGRLRSMGKGARQILAENISALIDRHAAGGRRSIRAWALARPAVDPKVVQRALGAHGPTVETIQALADKAGLEPWHLLVDGLDPARPPRIGTTMSAKALDLARALDAIDDEATRDRAYALAIQIVELGARPPAPAPAAPTAPECPELPPSASPRKARARGR